MSQIQRITVGGHRALAELAHLRSQYPATGLYPVPLGDPRQCDDVLEALSGAPSASAILQAAEGIDPMGWFRQRAEADSGLYGAEEGQWPDGPQQQAALMAHLDWRTREPKEEVVIGLLDVGAPWQVFARLNWGGWNFCPHPAEHCAVHRYWASQYGAEVVSTTFDEIECSVARPPADRETAMRLAWEQYYYCCDIMEYLEYGTETVAALGAALLDAPYWHFWCD